MELRRPRRQALPQRAALEVEVREVVTLRVVDERIVERVVVWLRVVVVVNGRVVVVAAGV